MKRLWLGISLLALFFIGSLLIGLAMDSAHLEIAEKLHNAADLVLEENYAMGQEQAQSAKAKWEKCWSWTAAVADHAPMDEIDGLFAQLKAFESPEDGVHYAATCAQLSKLVEAMAEAHRLSLENLL